MLLKFTLQIYKCSYVLLNFTCIFTYNYLWVSEAPNYNYGSTYKRYIFNKPTEASYHHSDNLFTWPFFIVDTIHISMHLTEIDYFTWVDIVDTYGF